MKSPQELLDDVERRLARTWADVITGSDTTSWPHAFPLGQPDAQQLSASFETFAASVRDWREWTRQHDVEVTWRPRRVFGTSQELPTHVTLDGLDEAALLVGSEWTQRLLQARSRQDVLTARYQHAAGRGSVLRGVERLSELDFALLCRAADWFAAHDATGMTPRQVPVDGMHAKWLNTRHALVRDLAGVADLRLLRPHPARIHFTYLDPAHREAGGRHHDSATVGDVPSLAYRPTIVIISENKDTAIHMPPIAEAISVEGVGKGGGTAAAFEWIRNAEHVLYWGDMDVAGFEILDGFRAAGVAARSLLMDMRTYGTWERYGTNYDPKGQLLKPVPAKDLPHLTREERELYVALAAPDWDRYRRIEQERIPLTVAHAAVLAATLT